MFVTRLTPQVEQELLTLSKHMSSPPVFSFVDRYLFFRPFTFGQSVVCSLVLFLLAIVLSVLSSFFLWPLCCLFFCPFSFGHYVVCSFVLFLLAIVLSVLLFTDYDYPFSIFKLFLQNLQLVIHRNHFFFLKEKQKMFV